MLAQRVDPAEEPQHRIERVDAFLGVHRGVRGLAVVRVAEADHRQAPRLLRLRVDEREVRSGMRGQRDVDAFEDARFEQADLPAAALLRRRADDLDRPGELVERGLRAESRAEVRDRDEIVPAGVADLGEGVVFREEGDRRGLASGAVAAAIGRPRLRASARRRAEGRLDAADASLDREAPTLERVRERLRGVALLEVQFRMSV